MGSAGARLGCPSKVVNIHVLALARAACALASAHLLLPRPQGLHLQATAPKLAGQATGIGTESKLEPSARVVKPTRDVSLVTMHSSRTNHLKTLNLNLTRMQKLLCLLIENIATFTRKVKCASGSILCVLLVENHIMHSLICKSTLIWQFIPHAIIACTINL